MTAGLDRSIGAVAMAALAAALAVAGIAQWAGGRSVPAAFQYVVPNATGYAVTGPLRDLWTQAPRHLARMFSQVASGQGRRFAENVTKELRRRCLGWNDLADLHALGLDGARGAAFSVVGNQTAIALPVSDPLRFAAFVEQLAALDNLTLSADVPVGQVLSAIRIDSNQSQGVLICSSRSGALAELTSGTAVALAQDSPDVPAGDTIQFSVSRAGSGPAEVRLRCSAVFADGTTGDCSCQLGRGPEQDCSAGAAVLEPMTSENTPFGKVLFSRLAKLKIHLLDDRMAVLASATGPAGDEAVVKAVASTRENFRFFRGDDTLLATLRHLAGIAGRDSGLVIGAVGPPLLPLTGRTHFAASFDVRQLKARAVVPWQNLQVTLLDQLSMPAGTGKSAGALSSDAELKVNDPALGYYLRFIDRYGGEAANQHLQRLGNFRAFMREIMAMEKVGAFRFGVRGVRDGVPDLAMSLELGGPAAESLLLKQRIQVRQARDLDILVAAAKKFVAERPQEELSATAQLSTHGYLKPEPGAIWDRYTIKRPLLGDMLGFSEWEDVFKPPDDWGDKDFATAEYDLTIEGRRIRYISPPIGDNDLLYRVSADPDNKIDEAALKVGRFRMAAHVDASNDRLIVAADKDTLADAVRALLADRGDALSTGKLRITGDPQFLVSQGLLYPDDGISQFIRDFLIDLEQYRSLDLRVDPLPSRQGIGATIVLSHE